MDFSTQKVRREIHTLFRVASVQCLSPNQSTTVIRPPLNHSFSLLNSHKPLWNILKQRCFFNGFYYGTAQICYIGVVKSVKWDKIGKWFLISEIKIWLPSGDKLMPSYMALSFHNENAPFSSIIHNSLVTAASKLWTSISFFNKS